VKGSSSNSQIQNGHETQSHTQPPTIAQKTIMVTSIGTPTQSRNGGGDSKKNEQKETDPLELSESGLKTGNIQLKISRLQNRVKLFTYAWSFVIALLIAIPLIAYFQLGLLGLLLPHETSTLTQVIDVMVSATIMAFVAKPTHDLVSWIEQVKNAIPK